MNLKDEREKNKLSQFALSKAAQVSRFKISQFENEFGELTKDELTRIRKVLKNVGNKKIKS